MGNEESEEVLDYISMNLSKGRGERSIWKRIQDGKRVFPL